MQIGPLASYSLLRNFLAPENLFQVEIKSIEPAQNSRFGNLGRWVEPCAQPLGPIGQGPASCSLGAHFAFGEEYSLEGLVQCSPWALTHMHPGMTSFGLTQGLGFSSNPTGGGGSKEDLPVPPACPWHISGLFSGDPA